MKALQYHFWSKSDMRNNVYRKLFKSDLKTLQTLPQMPHFMLSLKVFEGIWIYKKYQIIEVWGKLGQLWKEIDLNRQNQQNT